MFNGYTQDAIPRTIKCAIIIHYVSCLGIPKTTYMMNDDGTIYLLIYTFTVAYSCQKFTKRHSNKI